MRLPGVCGCLELTMSDPTQSTSDQVETPALRTGRSRQGGWLMWGVLLLMACAYVYSSRPRESAVAWEHDHDAGLARAAEKNQLVLLDFYADWCGPCKMMDREVFSREDVAEALADWVPVKVDAEANAKLADGYGIEGFPTFIALNPQGERLAVLPGGVSAEGFLDWIEQVENRRKQDRMSE